MRYALVAIALVAGAAEGRVIEPSVSRMCPGAASWDKVTECLARHGKPRVVKTQPNAKLVKLVDNGESGWRIPGLYLYVYTPSERRWHIAGMLQGGTWDVASFEKVSTKYFKGWRFVAKRAESDTQLSAEGTSTMLRQTAVVFCGDSLHCEPAVTSCDFYVDGKAYWTFRGTLEMGKGVVYVRGDRSKSGGECAQEEEVFLPEPPEPSIL